MINSPANSSSPSPETEPNKAYLGMILGALIASLGAVALFSGWHNPFHVFPWHHGTEAKPWLMMPQPRLSKAYLTAQLKPQTIIVGTSRAELAISTAHEGWRHRPVFNLALAGTSMVELASYFEHACQVAPVKQALVTLDYSSSDADIKLPTAYDPGRLATSDRPPLWTSRAADTWRTIGTWDALTASVTGMTSRPEEGEFLITGERYEPTLYKKLLKKGGLVRSFDVMHNYFPRDKVPLEKNWDPLRRIVQTAAATKVEIIWIIAPFHDHFWRLFAERDGLDELLTWRRSVVEIITAEGKSLGMQPPVIWDFDGTELTRMPVPAIVAEAKGQLPLFFEYSHFSSRVGTMMLDRVLLDKEPTVPGFGLRLSSENLAERLQTLRQLWSRAP